MQVTININGEESPDQLVAMANLLTALAAPGGSIPEAAIIPPTLLTDITPVASVPFDDGIDETTTTAAPLEEVVSPVVDPVVAQQLSATGEIDSAGVAWDASIHSSGKTQNKNKTWKLKKGVDKALVEQVIAAQTPAAIDTGAVAAVGAATGPGTSDDDAVAAAVFGAPAAQQPAAVDPAAAQAVTWPAILQVAGQAQAANTLNQEALNTFMAANGVTEFALMAGRTDLFVGLMQVLQS